MRTGYVLEIKDQATDKNDFTVKMQNFMLDAVQNGETTDSLDSHAAETFKNVDFLQLGGMIVRSIVKKKPDFSGKLNALENYHGNDEYMGFANWQTRIAKLHIDCDNELRMKTANLLYDVAGLPEKMMKRACEEGMRDNLAESPAFMCDLRGNAIFKMDFCGLYDKLENADIQKENVSMSM